MYSLLSGTVCAIFYKRDGKKVELCDIKSKCVGYSKIENETTVLCDGKHYKFLSQQQIEQFSPLFYDGNYVWQFSVWTFLVIGLIC